MYNEAKQGVFLKQLVKRLLSLVEFLQAQLRQQKEEILKPKYRLVDWFVKERTGEGYCRIQIIGTSQVLDYRPQELAGNEALLFGFSPQDISTITNLAHDERQRPKLKIVAIDFQDQSIRAKKIDGTVLTLAISQIKANKMLLAQLSREDIFRLGRLMGDNDSSLLS